MKKRIAFFISDSTGITARTVGQSVLSQFDNIGFEQITIPYVDSASKAYAAVKRINDAAREYGCKPIIFDTVIAPELNAILAHTQGLRFDVLHGYLKPLEHELNTTPSDQIGKAHGRPQDREYKDRIDAVHFAMANDDGASTEHYGESDLILIGVSRCGKTPTSLYMALQFGVFSANYPLTEDDLDELNLPTALKPYRNKLFGLTIDAERLSLIRNERRANSRYASLKQCEYEISAVEALYRRYAIPFINTTDFSIEEIATRILDQMAIKQQ